ncbi:MAG: lactonase family protein, partial [Acidimicrobiia bacterium]|nr:lactonase family protein [Acidimicrobiia bacterium]
AANYGTGNVVVLPVTAGDFGEVSSEIQHGGRGPNESRQEGPHAHCALFTRDNRFVVAADLGIDRILVYGFDEVGGRLTYQTWVATLPGAGPRHVAFHPNAPVMFGVNELDNALVAYDFDRNTGELRVRQAVSTVPPEAGESTAAGIQVSASGRHVYVSNRGDDSIAVFGFEDGTLARTAVRSCGGVWPRSIALTSEHLLVANRRSNEVVALPLTENGSDLGDPVASVTIEEPAHVLIG